MQLRDKSRNLITVIGLAFVASASSCESLPEDVGETKAAVVTSQSCQQGVVPTTMFQVGPCFPDFNTGKTMCKCFPRSPTNPDQVVTWSTPDTMVDADGNGIVDLGGPANATTKSILLNLDSCGSQRAPTNKWVVTNDSGFTATANVGSACTAAIGLPDRGTYHVQLTATYDNGVKVTTRDITMMNYVIVSLGDSIASGEGTPDVAVIPPAPFSHDPPTPARWENAACHRSAKSGPAQAALALERGDKNSTVTFIQNACTGAATGAGLETPLRGLTAQIGAAARALCPAFAFPADGNFTFFTNPVKSQCRSVDALILTVGANDINFAGIAENCSFPGTACMDVPAKDPISGQNTTLQAMANRDIAALSGRLAGLRDAINRMLPVNNVFFAEYHDFFADQTAKLCKEMVLPNAVHDKKGGLETFLDQGVTLLLSPISTGWPDDGYVDSREVAFLHDNIFIPFNDKLKATVKPWGWNFVSGIADEFYTHGYCSTSPWVVKYDVSKATQGDANGTFHPNAAGHQAYMRHILPNLLARLPNAPTSGRKVLADMNGDGRSDLPLSSGAWLSIPVGLSRSDGAFDVVNQQFTSGDTQVPTYANQNGARPLVGDFNGDGFGDVAFTGGLGWGTIPVAFSNGNGTFRGTNGGFTAGTSVNFPSIVSSPGAQPVAGDFNGDGWTDIAVMGTGIATIPVALSNGDGNWHATNPGLTAGPSLGAHASAKYARIVAGDFDHNGKTDIAIVTTTSENIPVAFSNGDGTFHSTIGGAATLTEKNFTAYLTTEGAELVAGDFNGDGMTDLAFVGGTGWTMIPVALSTGDGAFKFSRWTFEDDMGFPSLANEHGARPAVGDFNGDGVDDIALTGGTTWSNVPIAYSTGGNSFRSTYHGVATGETAFTTYASWPGATPSAYYTLNHVVKTNQAFYDTTTGCNVGGISMHCCPAGSAMVGVDLAGNRFKCAPLTNSSGTRALDQGGVRNNMRVCPLGQVMVGLHLDLNRLACQTVPGTYPVTTENVDTFSRDPSGMHVCNDVRFGAMTGIRADQDIYTCSVGN